MIFLLLLAGHDLLDHPDQLARLRTEPELIDAGIAELLRFTTQVPVGTMRVALEDLEIGGTRIPEGTRVFGIIVSANRDESIFPHAEELDLFAHTG